MSNRFFPNYPTYYITSPFGPRWGSFHYGIDLVAQRESGGTAVDYITAHTGGTVEACGYNSSAGNYVRIRISDRTVMSYCHFRDALPWKAGDTIEKGTVLGMMGSTGNSTGSHLHWGIQRDGQWIDPKPYLDSDYTEDGPASVPEESAEAQEKPKAQTCSVTLPVIRYGDTGESVRTMQALLELRGHPCGEHSADGIYGDNTRQALEAFQISRNLDPDTICGPLTYAALMGG